MTMAESIKLKEHFYRTLLSHGTTLCNLWLLALKDQDQTDIWPDP